MAIFTGTYGLITHLAASSGTPGGDTRLDCLAASSRHHDDLGLQAQARRRSPHPAQALHRLCACHAQDAQLRLRTFYSFTEVSTVKHFGRINNSFSIDFAHTSDFAHIPTSRLTLRCSAARASTTRMLNGTLQHRCCTSRSTTSSPTGPGSRTRLLQHFFRNLQQLL